MDGRRCLHLRQGRDILLPPSPGKPGGRLGRPLKLSCRTRVRSRGDHDRGDPAYWTPEPTEELQNSVHGSCEESVEAGEQRVQGSRGGGRGFPKAIVPSARDGDGDGDGVVCET